MQVPRSIRSLSPEVNPFISKAAMRKVVFGLLASTVVGVGLLYVYNNTDMFSQFIRNLSGRGSNSPSAPLIVPPPTGFELPNLPDEMSSGSGDGGDPPKPVTIYNDFWATETANYGRDFSESGADQGSPDSMLDPNDPKRPDPDDESGDNEVIEPVITGDYFNNPDLVLASSLDLYLDYNLGDGSNDIDFSNFDEVLKQCGANSCIFVDNNTGEVQIVPVNIFLTDNHVEPGKGVDYLRNRVLDGSLQVVLPNSEEKDSAIFASILGIDGLLGREFQSEDERIVFMATASPQIMNNSEINQLRIESLISKLLQEKQLELRNTIIRIKMRDGSQIIVPTGFRSRDALVGLNPSDVLFLKIESSK
jgi:hypothetical protein